MSCPHDVDGERDCRDSLLTNSMQTSWSVDGESDCRDSLLTNSYALHRWHASSAVTKGTARASRGLRGIAHVPTPIPTVGLHRHTRHILSDRYNSTKTMRYEKSFVSHSKKIFPLPNGVSRIKMSSEIQVKQMVFSIVLGPEVDLRPFNVTLNR